MRYKKPGTLSKRFKYPKHKLFFDYFSYIKGLNDEFISTKGKFGEIVSAKPRSIEKYNTPWSSFF